MEMFKSFISAMAYASLGFSFAAAYLKVNKIWKRKHIPEVANSVSIVGNVLDIIPLTFFALNFLLAAQWQGLIDSVLWIVAGFVTVLIGAGVWVQENRHKSFWRRVAEALKLERSEVTHLATTFFRPSSAEIILDILARFAYIDRDLDKQEQALIQSFADSWRLEVDWTAYRKLAEMEQPTSLAETRETVAEYLKTSPPEEQVAQLIDVLQALVAADDRVDRQEQLILDEVKSFMQSYVGGTEEAAAFRVIIAPQNRKQDAAIATLLPDAEKIEIAGGSGYTVGSYFSRDFAQIICDQYRALGFFTIDLDDRPEAPA
jgi:uncharacterized tellurite resistance protein B-like protein